MLKIKDNVDLKELERYGFTKKDNGYFRIIDEKDKIKSRCFVYVPLNYIEEGLAFIPKSIYVGTPLSINLMSKTNQYLVNDLIKADLVEKVDDK